MSEAQEERRDARRSGDVDWFRRFPNGGTVFQVDRTRFTRPPEWPNGGATRNVVSDDDDDVNADANADAE